MRSVRGADAAPVAEFLGAAESEVFAPLASPHGYTLAPEQRQYLDKRLPCVAHAGPEGDVIFVPPGAKRDKTRSPGFYEGVSQYLTDLDVPQV